MRYSLSPLQIIVLLSGAQVLLIGGVSASVWRERGFPKLARGTVIGVLSWVAALLLLAARSRLPLGLALLLFVGLAVFGQQMFYRAIEELYELAPTPRWIDALTAVALGALLVALLVDASPNHAALAHLRVLASAVPMALASASLSRRLRQKERAPRSAGARFVVSGATAATVIHGLRASTVFFDAPGSDLTRSPVACVALAGTMLVTLSFAMGLILEVEGRGAARLRQDNEALRRDALTDALTGLGNRRLFESAAEVELQRSRRHSWPMSVFVLDLDHFKRINDRWGHAVGDQVLIEVARCCEQALRAEDVLVRWGGEEFALLVPHCDRVSSARVAERLLASVRGLRCASIEGEEVTVSIGVAELEATDANLVATLNRADEALYEAKRRGRNRYAALGA